MDPIEPLASLAHVDTAAGLPIALAVAAVALRRRRRPLTRTRVMEVALWSILLVMLGLRYAALAAVTLAAPQAVLGPGTSPEVAGALFGLYVAAAAVGLIAWAGSVGWKVAGGLTFAAVTLVEVGCNLFLLSADAATLVDTGLAVALAAVTLVLTAFHWTHRSATPNPLGGKGPPFSY